MIIHRGEWRIESFYDYRLGGVKWVVYHDDRYSLRRPCHIGRNHEWAGYYNARVFDTETQAEEGIASFMLAQGG